MRWLGLLLSLGCATPQFVDRPVVWNVEDTRHVSEKPRERDYNAYEYMAKVFVVRRATRALELRDRSDARNTNAWDEVPNSSWFTNRIGVLDLTPAEVARGPLVGPDPVPPLRVIRGKSGGGNPGFLVKDQLGRTFLVKFDKKENPEMQTATDAIVSRILWSAGFNVPQDRVFFFCASDLEIAPGATAKNALKQKTPLTMADIEDVLASVYRLPDGCFRALASEFLPGAPLGGFPPEGVREDDPNDTVPHEDRRELRGLRVIAAWLNHTDMKEDNTLDMFVDEDGRRFVRHYLIDFGEAFGGHAAEKGRPEDGYEHFWDWSSQTLGLLSLGFWVRPWERLEETPWQSVGLFTSKHFDPEQWREAYPYWPFMEADDADTYWGAKLVMRFTRPMLEAIVAEGKLSDPAAAHYLVDALEARARAVGQRYLESMTPLDWFRVEGARLCMVDLGVRFGLASTGLTEVLDESGDVTEDHTVTRTGDVCVGLPSEESYAVLRVRTLRGRDVRPVMRLHVRGGDHPRLLGVVRTER